ncbi:MAG: hypothetical protein BWK73_25905 [Thiothrix lacustris]|uniref:Uncharacterized protein n=1 Tax=Thiothrix lacustris TaxID=525917 RepID=A0A1Y1QKZ5_9GAMM|nr:MAG: hypothetical protein BWK73_25905 [Thiothrix lacustris]
MPEISLFTYIMSHPLVWLGCALFMVASLVALSGRLSKRDSALIYTFVVSVLIVLMGVASAMSRMQQDKLMAQQPAAQVAPAQQQ